jgi:hypothetical protein
MVKLSWPHGELTAGLIGYQWGFHSFWVAVATYTLLFIAVNVLRMAIHVDA